MPISIRNSSKKSAASGKTGGVKNGAAGRLLATPAKLSKKWRFAPDAIGMFDGPSNLSRRKGLSA